MHYDGETVSLDPSVGNWEYECMSHYWIDRGRIRWAPAWTREEIENGRLTDLTDLDDYFEKRKSRHDAVGPSVARSSWPQRVVAIWSRSLNRLAKKKRST